MKHERFSLLGRLRGALFALILLTPTGSATWSLVVCDTQTGEVCVASATCIPNVDIRRVVPMILVGVGGAAAQSAADTSGQNRQFIRGRMLQGVAPRQILLQLSTSDPAHQTRQYGMSMLEQPSMTWTGSGAGFARHGVTGNFFNQTGGLVRYAIQGNVLAGNEVVEAARFALIHTKGDLTQKIMSAMEAARAFGGDGRCSCSQSNPSGCGSPPDDFNKAAHVGHITLARMGDVDGICNAAQGCANGQYFLDLQSLTGAAGPDPIIELRGMYADWRANLIGRPDHLLSSAEADDDSLPADGLATTTVHVQLADIAGDPLMSGGAVLWVEWNGEGPEVATPGAVTDHGGGRYSFALTATTLPGPGRWTIKADDGLGEVRIWPDVELELL